MTTDLSDIEFGYRPPNGTSGDYFRAQTCDRCVKDHDWHNPETADGDSCPIIMSSISGEYRYPNPLGPPEWSHNYKTGESRCAAFEGPCSCDG